MTRETRPLKIQTTYNHRSTLQNVAGLYTAILDIHLADPDLDHPPSGSTARFVYEHLNTLTRGIVAYVKMPFDFGTPEGIKDYTYGVKKLVGELHSGCLSRYVFLTRT